MKRENLEKGQVYFSFGFEDECSALPIISTYVYLGVESGSAADHPKYLFRFVGSTNELELEERQLDDVLLSGDALIDRLQDWLQSTHSNLIG